MPRRSVIRRGMLVPLRWYIRGTSYHLVWSLAHHWLSFKEVLPDPKKNLAKQSSCVLPNAPQQQSWGKWSGPDGMESHAISWPPTAPGNGQVVDPATHDDSSMLQHAQQEIAGCVLPSYVLVQRSAPLRQQAAARDC